MQDIKYQYAINSSGETVNAANLIASKEVRNEAYKCVSCDHTLIPVLGEKRKKHFRHKADIQVQCSLETYLHKLGKIRFHEIYTDCLAKKIPFWIEIEITQKCTFYKQFQHLCRFRNKYNKRFDLTQYFKNIRLEKKDNCFVPDLLLTSDKGEKLYIEIVVTHQSTIEKISSGHRIIELTLHQESDIKILERNFLSENDTVEFFNFRREHTKNMCAGECVHKMQVRTEIKQYEPPQLRVKKLEIKKTPIPERTSTRNDVLLKQLATSQFKEHCFFCHHHTINALDTIDTPIYCKVRKKTCNPHIAKNCKHYQPDMKLISDTSDSPQTNL
ncbi:MAG: hypothetical protein RMZ69_15045 [Nostoc sp. ChiQUE01a]|nr:hypothetical protein [Nostoc sp. ChiQUE01a]